MPFTVPEFIISPIGIVFLIYAIFAGAFAIVGIRTVLKFVRNWQRTRNGWIKIHKKLSSNRWVWIWVRPVGKSIKVKDENKNIFELPFKTEMNMMAEDSEYRESPAFGGVLNPNLTKEKAEPTNELPIATGENMLGYIGSTPFAQFDENWNQIALDRTTTTIPREHSTRMFNMAWLSGFLSALTQNKREGLLILIILVISVLGLVIGGYGIFNSMGASANQKAVTDTILTNQNNMNVTLTQIATKIGLNSNGGIPTVG